MKQFNPLNLPTGYTDDGALDFILLADGINESAGFCLVQDLYHDLYTYWIPDFRLIFDTTGE